MSNYGKKDLKSFVRIDGSGRVVGGSLILRRKMPKSGRWKEISTYPGPASPELGQLPGFKMGALSVDADAACAAVAPTTDFYFDGTNPFPVAGDSIFTDAAGTIPFAGGDGFYASSDVAGEGGAYEISDSIVVGITLCA